MVFPGEAETSQNPVRFFLKNPFVSGGLVLIILLAVVAVWVLKVNREQPKKPEIQISSRQFYDPARGFPPGFPPGLPLDKPLDVMEDSQIKITYPYDPFSAKSQPETSEGEKSGISAFDPAGKTVVTAITLPLPKNTEGAASAGQNPVTYLESTVSYQTKFSLKQGIDAYKNYFKENKWQIAAENGNDQVYTILAAKSREKLKFVYSKNSITKKNSITLVYTGPEMTAQERAFIEQLRKVKK
jgi:hypothetical protein